MTKISDLTALTGAGVDGTADLFPIVDMSLAGAARNKKITIDEAKIALGVGAAITELDDIPDVNAPAPTNGDVLTWDSTPGEWVSTAPTTGATTLDGLTDVNAPTPGNGEVLTWDSTPGEWVSQALPGAGAFVLDDATDCDTTGQTTGDVLTYNGAEWVPQAPAGDADGNAALTKPVAASFTLENAGTASMADGTNGLVLTAPSATVNGRFMRYTAGLPGASWTLTTRARVIGPHNAQVHVRCIMVRNSTNGRLLTFGDVSNTNTGCQRWSSYTAASTSPFNYGVNAADIPWRRVSSDGTTLTFSVSCDGHEWSIVGTEAIAAYLTAAGGGSLDQAGIGLFIGAAPTVSQKNIFQHFELV